jgi:hypothetical protein
MKLLIVISCLVTFGLTAQEQRTPIIFVHGMLAAGDTCSNTVQNFTEAGYSQDELHILDWNTLNFNRSAAQAQLDSLVSVVLKSTKSKKVNLVGHSAGGGVCSTYITTKKNYKKVERYVHLASGALPVTIKTPTLNLYSPDDLVTGGKDIKYALNHSIAGMDHYEIATSDSSFNVMYQFFNPEGKRKEVKVVSVENVLISGKACTLGENQPERNAEIEIYAFDAVLGQRDASSKISVKTDEFGNFGPLSLSASNFYEFVVHPTNGGKKSIHYFREPFQQDNHLVYLRTLPTGGFASMMLGDLPSNEHEVGLAIFSASKALIHGRDELVVNGIEITTKELASDKKTAIAFFLYKSTDKEELAATPIQKFANFPFMSGADVWVKTAETIVRLTMNKRSVVIPAIPSSEGISVVVFD